MSLTTAVVIGFLALFSAKVLTWVVQLKTQNAGLVDAVWSWALGALGVWYALCGTAPVELRYALAAIAGFWGFRLGTHLYVRHIGKAEDGRYRRFREQWGDKANFNMFWFFQFQTVFSMLLGITFCVVAWSPAAPSLPVIIGSLIFGALCIAGEGLADLQLEQFKNKPENKGKVCNQGLWKYSRHPNYFFECLHWLAYLGLASASPYWYLSLSAPLVIWFLLMKMSGIPLTEAQAAKTRPEYAEYIRVTSPLIPWFPKK
jgi:steroid 5-alpha reductase family enzyme